ncbi:hypothetical protein ES703_117761 [subsurface metagenome]
MTKQTKYWLTCSRCSKRFSGVTRAEALNKMRKHLWKFHADWMVRRIKAGQKKAKAARVDSPGSSFWNPSWIGFAERPLIEKVTGMPYEEVKSKVLDFLVQALLGGVRKP